MNTNAAARDRLVARRSTALRRRLLPVLIAGCFCGAATANPLGPQVVNGQVSFNNQGNVLSVTNTPGSIINWQSFSINPGELTRFIQQNPNSAVLNRIIGQDPSQILGALQSNGRVFLINPNGILFGQGAQVDVNGLVASTLNISNEDFLTGKLHFKAGDKAGILKNQGAITTPAGGQVYLIAPNVENSGIITSPKGEVLLAAGRSVQLVDSMNPDLHVVVSAPEDEALNLGQVIAQGGKTGIYGALVKQRGIVSANSAVVGEDGKVVFKASRDIDLEAGSRTSASGARGGEVSIQSQNGATRVAGTVEAIGTQENGGEIRLLGKEVSLVDNAAIDVSGKRGGGTVLAGGDYQGSNPLVQNALTAYMGSDTSIKADASDEGNGGKVILWSDGSTTAHGNISARGGALSGSGGLIETSGHTIDFSRVRVNTSAGKGPFGLWLIDPQDLVIDAAGAGNIVSNITGSDITLTTAACNTTYGTCGPGTSGNITVSSPITMINAGGRKLALVADNNIVINSAIGDSGMGTHVDLQASGAITLNSNISLTGTLKASASGGLTQPGGIITANSLQLLGSGNFSLGSANSIGTVAANISGDLALQTGGVVSVGTVGATNGITAAGNITLTAGGAANINDIISSTTGGTVNVTGTAVTISSPGGISAGAGTVNVAATAGGGMINVGAGTQIAVTGAGQINLKSDDLTLTGTLDAGGPNGTGKVAINPYNATRVIDIGTDTANRLGLTSTELNKVLASELLIGDSNNTGGVEVTNDVTMANTSVKKFGLETSGNISTSDVNKRIITDNGNVALKATGTGAISIGGVRTGGGTVDAVAGGMIVLREVLTTPAIGAGGNVVLNAGGLLTVDDVDARPGSVNPYGDVTLISGAGISVTNANTIYADDLKMTAVSGIHGTGNTDYANVRASNLNATNTGSGDIRVSNSGTDMTINDGGVAGANGIEAASGIVDIKNASGYKISIQAPVVTHGAPLKITGPKGIDFVAYVAGSNTGGLVASNGGQLDLLATDSNALINMPAGASITSSNGAVTLFADNMAFTGSSIAAGSGQVLLAPYNSAAAVKLGAGAADAAATLGLTDSELGTIATSNSLQVGSVFAVPSGTVDVVGALDLVTPGKLSGGFDIYTASGAINVNGPITTPGNAKVWTGSGTLTNNAAITAANTVLNGSKMALAGGTVSSPTGYVQLSGGTNAFHLGTDGTDATASTVELSNAELGTISASTLRVGTVTTGGPITIKSTLTTGFSAMSLYSGGAITQDAGAKLGGATSFNLRGASVTLTEANPTGVIAGSATSGDFKYHSLNGIHVGTVDGGVGIAAGVNNVFLESDFVGTSAVIQTTPINAGGLAVKAVGGVTLDNTSNSIGKVAADLNPASAGTGAFTLRNSGAISVDTVLGVNGISTKNKDIIVKSDSGAITVNQAVSAATGSVATGGNVVLAGTGLSIVNSVTGNDINLEGDSLSLGASVTGTIADIYPRTSALPITVGAGCAGCLSLTNLHKMNVQTIGIGKTAAPLPGAITVAGITTGGTGLTDVHATTTRIGLLTGSTVSQTSGTTINVHDLGISAGGTVNLPEANAVVNLAGSTTSGAFTFNNTGSFYVSTLSGGAVADGNSYSLGGVMTAGGNILLTSTAGDITLDPSSPISAVTGAVTLSAGAGAISGPTTSVVVGGMLNASAANGIALKTMVSTLAADNNGLTGDINIANYAPLSLHDILQSNSGASTGSIAITNTGAVSQPSGKSVSAKGGSINILAQSPLTLGGGVMTTSGAITLEAGMGSSPNDILTISGTVSSGTGNITLKAGDGIIGTATTGGTLTVQANKNAALSGGGGGTTAPTVDQCTSNPSLSGCSTVLPTLGSCAADPTLAGCTAVLPTLSSCTTNPSQDGCTAVLPTLSSCTTNPGQEGCAAVLPTLSSCTTNPSQDGCTAVLPTVNSCATTPTLAGCSAVLPTVSACTASPSLAGCTAVLPTLSSCATTPTLAGCSAVLPTVSACTASPSLAGCAAVLPTLSNCTTAPTLAGCSAVLPPLSSCTATPSLEGCSAVLPTVSACATAPSLAGCSAVLPTVSSCTAAPTQAGCAAVLPTVSACTATPALEGCSAVLPSLSQCSATPTLEGCSVVVPVASKCTVNPSSPECATVLPVTGATAAKETFTETVNDTVKTVVLATTTAQVNTVTEQASSSPSSGSSPAAKSASKSADKGEDKKDEKKDEKKTTAGPDDSGAKKNEAAKKMYCN